MLTGLAALAAEVVLGLCVEDVSTLIFLVEEVEVFFEETVVELLTVGFLAEVIVVVLLDGCAVAELVAWVDFLVVVFAVVFVDEVLLKDVARPDDEVDVEGTDDAVDVVEADDDFEVVLDATGEMVTVLSAEAAEVDWLELVDCAELETDVLEDEVILLDDVDREELDADMLD